MKELTEEKKKKELYGNSRCLLSNVTNKGKSDVFVMRKKGRENDSQWKVIYKYLFMEYYLREKNVFFVFLEIYHTWNRQRHQTCEKK